jgi:ABC-2 type transport system permease protein
MPEKRVRHPLIELTNARLMEFLREPEAVFWVFVFPLIMTLALGFAFRQKPPDLIPVGVVNDASAPANMKAIEASPVLLPKLVDREAGIESVRHGRLSLLIEGANPPIYRFDPTRPDARTARVEVDDVLQSAAGREDRFTPREEKVTEIGSRYIDFLVPGLLGMNIMGTGMWGIGFSIVNARMRKILKRLVATPMRRGHFLIAQILSRFIFLFLEVTVLLLFTKIVFHVFVRGSIFTFALICMVGGAAFAGVGLLIASRARTIEAVSGLTNVVMMPMWLCSGVFFSYERFPEAAKPFIRLLPLTAMNDSLRGVMNEGWTLVQVLPQLGYLALLTVITYAIALKMFRWQ